MSPEPTPTDGHIKPAGPAKKLSGMAANLLATGLILVAGLAFGRQVLQWWKVDRVDAKTPLVPAADPLGSSERPHRLEFGELPGALRRATMVGGKRAAFALLREQATLAVKQPHDKLSEAGPAEQRMLSHIGLWQPVLQDRQRWEVYELDGPVLLAAGIQFTSDPNAGAVARAPEAVGRRVVFWGLAVPAADSISEEETRWTLFTYSPASAANTRGAALAEMPLPPGAKRTLALAAEDGGQLIAFRGAGEPVIWQKFFESNLARDGWNPCGPWQGSAGTFHARFEKPGLIANVQWGREQNGESTGVVSISLSGDNQ